jgi:hypothetical protein
VSRPFSKQHRETFADGLIVVGGAGLFGSLFLTWSHQFSPAFLSAFGSSALISGVPRDPTAWQVYSTVDIVLALLAAGLVAVAVFGTRTWRVVTAAGALIAVAFTLHALGAPPTNGANLFNPSLSVPDYVSPGATAGIGETVALIGLVLALVGLAVSFTAD